MKMIGHFLNQLRSKFLKRGILFLSPKDMQEAKKSMKQKGIKAEDVKNLSPIEEIHGLNLPLEEPHCLDNPTHVVKVNSPYRFDEGDIPHNKSASQCSDEFDNFIVKQENFNAYVSRQLKRNAYMLDHLGDYMSRTVNDLKLISKQGGYII